MYGGGSTTKSDSSVAEVTIGGATTYYDNIREAFAEADVNGQTATVKLLKTVALDDSDTSGIKLSNGSNITFDLNGCTLSQRTLGTVYLYSATIILKNESGSLTIKDSSGGGAIVQPNASFAVYNEKGTLTIESGSFQVETNEWKSSFGPYAVRAEDKTYIKGGAIGAEGYNGLVVQYSNVDVQLSGGTYSTIAGNNRSLDSILAANYTFKYADDSGFPDLTQSSVNKSVKVVAGAPGVSYKDVDGSSKIKESTEFVYLAGLNTGAAYPVTLTAGWYAAKGNITIDGNVKAEDGVNIILCDNSNVSVNGQMMLSGRLTIYGQSGDTGKMTVSASDSSAFVTSESGAEITGSVCLYGGEITATGSSKAFDTNVSLANTSQDQVKCIVTENEQEQVAGVHQNATVAICKCKSHRWNYTPSATSRQHIKTCRLCGYNPNGENAAEACTYDKFVNNGETGHKKACVCGNTDGDVITHTSTTYTINDDGLTHSGICNACKAVLSNKTHTFDGGECVCQAKLAATYNNGNYASLQTAVNAAGKNEGTVAIAKADGLLYENIQIQNEQLLKIDLNQKALIASSATDKGAIAIDGGNIFLTNGKVDGSVNTNATNAIVLKKGSLTLGSNIIIKGGEVDYEGGQIFSAIKITDSSAVLNLSNGNVLLNGLEVPSGKVLADYLPSGCAFAKCNADGNLTNSDTPEIVNAYTNADGKPCTSLIENLKVVEHTHSYTGSDGVYKCACGYVCEHKNGINRGTGCCPDCKGFVAQASVTANNVPAYYLTAQEAISAANGSTVMILSNVDSITVSNQASIDLNSKTVGTIGIEAGNLTVSCDGKINTLNIEGGDLDISDDNVEVGSLTVSGGTVSLSGGKFSSITVPDGVKIKDILANGYGFKTGENVWASEEQLDSKSITNVTVKQLPIQSLTYKRNINIAYGQKATLAVTPEKASGAGDVTYQWYSGTSLISGATGSTLEISDLTVNKDGYTYCVEATCDGYTYKSENITVTVNKVAPAYTTTPTGKANLSYTGIAQELITAGSTEDGTIKYRVDNQTTDSVSTATNAGTYTVYYRIIGDENHNDSEEQSIEVRIAPMKLKGIVKPENSAIAKAFDGTTSASLSSVKFCNEENSEIEINSSLYEITDVHFNDANAGNDKSLYFTVKLKSNNYILSTNKDLATEETYNCDGYSISKATAPILENVKTSLKYADTAKQTVSAAGKMPANAGTLTYAKGTTDQISYVDSWNVGEDGTVTYTISGANAGNEITLPVKISSTNYNDATVNVVMSITRATPTGMPYYENITASGKTLADAKLSVKDAAGNNLFSTAGEVAWKDGNDKSVEQGAEYEWIFTPTDTNYETITGKTILWAKQASGGGGAATPAEEEVITVKDDTASETTTMTTVKDTKVETVKNEQGEEISKITATVSEKVAEKLVNQAISNKSDTVEITVKSNNGNKADGEKQIELEIPKKTVESIAKDTDATLVIKGDNGQVNLDNKTLEVIASETTGEAVRIVVNENTGLKEEQKPAADAIGESGKVFDIQAVVGNKVICDFKGGKVHITLHVPERLKGKEIAVIYISDKGVCETLDYIKQTAGGNEYVEFVTTHFLNFAIVEKADAEKLIEKQNADKINSLIKEVKLKATTSKTSKKNVKVKVSVRNNSSLIKEAKTMGYTVKYKFYRSTKKTSKYKAAKTKTSNIYINTKGKKGSKYYYKAKVLVYDGKKFVSQSTLKQCSYGVRRWSK